MSGTAAREALLADLNLQQRQGVCHEGGPLLIVAGAGTGKTTTLAHRVTWLIAGGVDPSRILLLTFTRRAAAELLRRVDALLQRTSASQAGSRSAGRRVWGGTFHAVAARLLRRHGAALGLDGEFTIVDRSDAEDLLNLLRGEIGLHAAGKRFPLKGTCLDIYSRTVNTREPLETVLRRDFPWCIQHGEKLRELFAAYVDRKEDQRVLDYDDLLVFWQALVSEPAAAATLRAKFDCVLVDEYQDTNALQAEILKGLCPDGRGLTVVGDDAQAIYSFRAATVRNILDFPREFAGTTIVTLEQNYRSTQPLLEATNAVIAHADEWHRKELWSARQAGPRPALVHCRDEDEQTAFVIEQVLAARERGVALQRQAVLFRASHHSLDLEVELSRRNIPFHKYGGLKFIETAHVKDLLAYLRLAENPRDLVAGLRVLMLLPGIGAKTARRLMDELAAAAGRFAAWRSTRLPAAVGNRWPALVDLLSGLADRRTNGDVPSQVHAVRTFYAPLLEQKHDHASARLRDLEQIELIAARFPDRARFLAEITLDPPASTQDLPADPHLDEDWLVLSTIHSAKGLEWDSVYVLHAADGNIPADMAARSPAEIEEERRLFYVALTRARNRLFVCWPQRYYFTGRFRGDGHSYAKRTRFLPDDTLRLFDIMTPAGEEDADEPGAALPGATTQSVRERMKALWGDR
ncbi:MAG: ATP-dependent helicase [Planctomycetes bacterium]|nr:ATP-dependent helicase [Planctomycetota bacterium]